ncbi:hypothetical protein Taro_031924, partial [Colocasia esculenta]|nr:hypothetical protein [Colocasia esculenta]
HLVVKLLFEEATKRYSDINKKSKSHHKYFHCAGTKSFADINEEETKLQEVKITQPSSSSSSSIASADDIYSQVFGKERPGRVRGVGTGPTPTSLWGTSSQCQAQLRAENAQLNAMVKELSERLGKVKSIVVDWITAVAKVMALDDILMALDMFFGNEFGGFQSAPWNLGWVLSFSLLVVCSHQAEKVSKQVESTPNMERCVQSSASVIEPKGKESLMLDKKVKLCDMEG